MGRWLCGGVAAGKRQGLKGRAGQEFAGGGRGCERQKVRNGRRQDGAQGKSGRCGGVGEGGGGGGFDGKAKWAGEGGVRGRGGGGGERSTGQGLGSPVPTQWTERLVSMRCAVMTDRHVIHLLCFWPRGGGGGGGGGTDSLTFCLVDAACHMKSRRAALAWYAKRGWE